MQRIDTHIVKPRKGKRSYKCGVGSYRVLTTEDLASSVCESLRNSRGSLKMLYLNLCTVRAWSLVFGLKYDLIANRISIACRIPNNKVSYFIRKLRLHCYLLC